MTTSNLLFIEQPKHDSHRQPFPKPHLEAFETPLRIEMAVKYLDDHKVLDDFKRLTAKRAKTKDALLVHSPFLVESVERMSEIGSGQLGESAFASPELLRSALYALGGSIEAAKGAVSGEYRHSFAAIRPPGHHAATSTSMGLCYFNNIAVSITKIMKEDGVKRVSIIDFDDHFGNGTAEIFYTNPDVQYISVHEYDYESYGIGHFEEVGHGKGKGTNVNIPLVESSPDVSYDAALKRVVIPMIERFEPEIIAVSAGYDAHYSDPVGNMNIDSRTFWLIGKMVENVVSSLNLHGSFWILEGGYNPLALGPCIRASLAGLIGLPLPKLEDQVDREEYSTLVDANEEVIEKVLEVHSSAL
ncbi:MAG: histone deacetylase [Candidatus Hodarchaeota archaeon]